MWKADDFDEVCKIVNENSEILSMLYDLDLLPEQTCAVPYKWHKTSRLARWMHDAMSGSTNSLEGAR